ncbi:MAG: hypothetical protein HYW91_02430 [Candidatus Sungbacteria bacterium]|nr:hypothetical protein [Candidatus Sungbacteria bacterium]
MGRDFEKPFSHLEPPEPPAGLLVKVMDRIRREESLLMRRRLILFSAAVLSSAGASAWALNSFWAEFVQSGFAQFLSLFFSDFGLAFANWQDFGFALAESMPATIITAFLAPLLVFLWSLKNFAQAVNPVSSIGRDN